MRSEVCKNLPFCVHVSPVVEWRVWCAKLRPLISLFSLRFPLHPYLFKNLACVCGKSVCGWMEGGGGQTGSPPQVKFNFPRDCLFWSNPIGTTKSIAMVFYEKFSFTSTDIATNFPLSPTKLLWRVCVPGQDSANFVCRGPLYLSLSVSLLPSFSEDWLTAAAYTQPWTETTIIMVGWVNRLFWKRLCLAAPWGAHSSSFLFHRWPAR